MAMVSGQKSKLVIIGLDGAPYDLIEDLTQKGVMPNMAELLKKGQFRRMTSSIPEVSSVAWSSIITGKNPGEHGIYGFTELAPGTYRLFFPTFHDLKAAPFWHCHPDEKSIIINVPATYPAKPLNGVHISGFVALELEKAVYPPSLIEPLKALDYRVDVDSTLAHKSIGAFLTDLDRTLDARIKAYRHLWDSMDWDNFMLVFTGPDRLSHFLWDAYEDPSHQYHEAFLNHFRKIDRAIGEIAERLRPTDTLIMLSDHGFERLQQSIYINVFLKEQGFLKLRRFPARSYNDIAEGTVAFALDPGRIYLNRKGRYPRGAVSAEDEEKVLQELIEAFDELRVDGRKAVSRIYPRGEVYRGPYEDLAPDLVLLPAKGVDFKAVIKSAHLTREEVFTGKHTQHNAFLLVYSPEAENMPVPERPSVFDVVSIIELARLTSLQVIRRRAPAHPQK